MKPAAALMKFFKIRGTSLIANYQPVAVTELREFKQSISQEEYLELAKQACELMGEVFEPI